MIDIVGSHGLGIAFYIYAFVITCCVVGSVVGCWYGRK